MNKNSKVSYYLDGRGKYHPLKSEQRRNFLKSIKFRKKWANFATPLEYLKQRLFEEDKAIDNFINVILNEKRKSL